MMGSELEVTVSSTNQKLGYTGSLRSLPPITMDYIPPLGDGQGYMPLEMVLMGLGACSGGTIGFLLRKMGNSVSGVTVKAKGIRREECPTSFQKIFLDFTVTSRDAKDADIQKAIQLAEESVCLVWQMLKGNVEIMTEYRIITSSSE
jgi:putative redox protein